MVMSDLKGGGASNCKLDLAMFYLSITYSGHMPVSLEIFTSLHRGERVWGCLFNLFGIGTWLLWEFT